MTPDEALYKKIALGLIPFMMALYLVAFLDRVNISFAALTMNAELGLSPTVYGWGAGIFFIGYFIFEADPGARRRALVDLPPSSLRSA